MRGPDKMTKARDRGVNGTTRPRRPSPPSRARTRWAWTRRPRGRAPAPSRTLTQKGGSARGDAVRTSRRRHRRTTSSDSTMTRGGRRAGSASRFVRANVALRVSFGLFEDAPGLKKICFRLHRRRSVSSPLARSLLLVARASRAEPGGDARRLRLGRLHHLRRASLRRRFGPSPVAHRLDLRLEPIRGV